jgi:hypothetical protein
MYNANKPAADDLPSSGQLLKSTFIALGVAAVILVTAVLPGEYGIDPTGVGRVLGLTQMGEIKTQLAAEAAVAAAEAAEETQTGAVAPVEPSPSAEPAPKADPVTEQAVAAAVRDDEMSIMLVPGQGAEIKLEILKGKIVKYHWSGNGGRVNHDTHGDPYGAPKGFYHGYGKGRAIASDEGELTAAFDGKHGWFWRNRSKEDVKVTLRVEGEYIGIERVQ